MQLKVLVVDDSSFFRRRVSEIIDADPGLKVIDAAVNGKEAVEKVRTLKPDVVTMDIEMPVMNGIDAVKSIMAANPVPILMFSSLTHEGAKATLEALEAGALDFLPKKFEDIARDRKEASNLLVQRIKEIARRRFGLRPQARPASPAPRPATAPSPALSKTQQAVRSATSALEKANAERRQRAAASQPEVARTRPAARNRASGKSYKLLAIGTSTGGPVALQTVLTQLPANYPLPILLIQHMPAAFTGAFAQRLNSLCKINVKEAENGDAIKPGCAYLAPGGKQMMVEGSAGNGRIKIIDGGERMNYKPCVDVTFGAAAKIYGGDVLAVVLTGMGADGRDGARMLKTHGAKVWAQDEASCVVYGMPQAVASAGIAEDSIALGDIAERIVIETANG
ncbi:chemotaxis response regulator protein-glutamate methylesterase of group 1 operon [Neiella marina]|uniref:Protein-glutamate methylesterase/protein-glutamine glutaminase n=1 Tax=Neiella marina TaxID=508461 RepID=A0A8J2U5D0_9GAMM|nr:chemotaxis response regulator protein-glutamate methylesterase [Neiella marina]GGA78213.1 chemotaxis response regulator protein-glutamate methylesterase of group 1 operon [Neiella marina]